MAAMPLLCDGILLFQCNLPRVLPMLILEYASCLIPYIDLFLFVCGEWSSLAFKDFKKYGAYKSPLFRCFRYSDVSYSGPYCINGGILSDN